MFRLADRGSESDAAPQCALRVHQHSEWTAVLVRGELDLDWSHELERTVLGELARGLPVIVELAGLDFIDVNGVRTLARLVGEARDFPSPAALEIHGPRGQVADLVDRVGLRGLLDQRRSR